MAVQIFISYARDDDVSPPGQERAKGFVTSLQEQLEYEFKRLGQPRPKLWRDQRIIERGDQFEPLIEDAIKGSAFLIVVHSRNWISRPWCVRELETFAKQWNHESEHDIRQRIVVVHKHLVSSSKLRPLLQGQEGYTFFSAEDHADEGHEYEFFDRGRVRDDRYFHQIQELSSHLWRKAARISDPSSKLAPRLASTHEAHEPQPRRLDRIVYLAKPADDMLVAYNRVGKELIGRGYSVVPPITEEIPRDSSSIDFIDSALAQAELSIHLLGERPGFAPDGDDIQRIVKLQMTHAGRRVLMSEGNSATFHRIVWAPSIFDAGAEAPLLERDPLNILAKFDTHLPTDKIIGDGISRFVEFMVKHLDKQAVVFPKQLAIEPNAKLYLYHHARDTTFAMALAKTLAQKQVIPILPAMEGAPAELMRFHRQNLIECDAILLCWAEATEVWARAASREFRNWRDLGRTESFDCRGLVTGPPPAERKAITGAMPPSGEIDFVLDLTHLENITTDAIEPLVQVAQAGKA